MDISNLISINKNNEIPLHRQLFEQIRNAIITRSLQYKDPLPPSRTLALQLGVSRTVILEAYNQLKAEGYIETSRGSGTYISKNTIIPVNNQMDCSWINNNVISETDELLIKKTLPLWKEEHSENVKIDFRHGIPSWDSFPMDKWQKALVYACKNATPKTLTYGPAKGSQNLICEIARILRNTRAIPFNKKQIVVTTGATQGLDILARLFISKGDVVIVEEPSHTVLRELFKFSGAHVIPVPVDKEGLCVNNIEEYVHKYFKSKNIQHQVTIKLIYVTPSHQFPTGVIMSLQRRLMLIEWCKNNGALIIEDDYDSEYSFSNTKISALAGLSESNQVIYIGSFSKVLFPSLRLAYIVLPENIVERFLSIKWFSDRLTPLIEQEALAEFIRNGNYSKHVRKMNILYASKRKVLKEIINEQFGSLARIIGADAGLHLFLQLKVNLSEEEIAKHTLKEGVKIYPASEYYTCKPNYPSFILGYGSLSNYQIELGIQKLYSVVNYLNNKS